MADTPSSRAPSAFDEMHADGGIRTPYAEMARFLDATGEAALDQKRRAYAAWGVALPEMER